MPSYPPPMPPSEQLDMPEAPSYSVSGKLFDMDDEEDLYGQQPDKYGQLHRDGAAHGQGQGDGSNCVLQ